jgi:hypothetical protein
VLCALFECDAGGPHDRVRSTAAFYTTQLFFDYVNRTSFSFREPTKTSRRFLEDGTKVRVSKKTGQLIPKPDPLFDRKPRSSGQYKFLNSMLSAIVDLLHAYEVYRCN